MLEQPQHRDDPFPLLPPEPPSNYPSSDELFSDDDDPLPPPVVRTFPERQHIFSSDWTQQDESDFRRFVAAGWISLGRRASLATYDHAVVAEKLYFKDRLERDRELRRQPPAPPGSSLEPSLPPLAPNEVDYFVKPDGLLFFFHNFVK